MTLIEYLAQPGRTATELASVTGSAVSTITRAAQGKLTPSRDLMLKIFGATDGLVAPNDFFGISATPQIVCPVCDTRTDRGVLDCTATDCPHAVRKAA